MFLDACFISINQYQIVYVAEHFGKTQLAEFVSFSVVHCTDLQVFA